MTLVVPIFKTISGNLTAICQISQLCPIIKYLRIGTPKSFNLPFAPNGKLSSLGVSIFKHIRTT